MTSTDRTATRVVLITAPDLAVGKRIAHALVLEKLAACVNVVPGVTSVYTWQGRIEEASEVMLVAKTMVDRIDELESALKRLHPYDVPEFIVLEAAHVEARYAAWLVDSTRGPATRGALVRETPPREKPTR